MVTTIGAGVEYVGFTTTTVAAPAAPLAAPAARFTKGEWVLYTPHGQNVAKQYCVMWTGPCRDNPSVIKVGLKSNPRSRQRLFYVNQDACRS